MAINVSLLSILSFLFLNWSSIIKNTHPNKIYFEDTEKIDYVYIIN